MDNINIKINGKWRQLDSVGFSDDQDLVPLSFQPDTLERGDRKGARRRKRYRDKYRANKKSKILNARYSNNR